MAAFSDYLETKLLEHVLLGIPYTPPDNVYVALHPVSPGDDGLGAEVVGASYERKLVTFTAVVDSSTSNEAALVWVNMPLVTVTHVGIWDAATAGNLLFHGALLEARPLSAGDPFSFNIGDLDVAID